MPADTTDERPDVTRTKKKGVVKKKSDTTDEPTTTRKKKGLTASSSGDTTTGSDAPPTTKKKKKKQGPSSSSGDPTESKEEIAEDFPDRGRGRAGGFVINIRGVQDIQTALESVQAYVAFTDHGNLDKHLQTFLNLCKVKGKLLKTYKSMIEGSIGGKTAWKKEKEAVEKDVKAALEVYRVFPEIENRDVWLRDSFPGHCHFQKYMQVVAVAPEMLDFYNAVEKMKGKHHDIMTKASTGKCKAYYKEFGTIYRKYLIGGDDGDIPVNLPSDGLKDLTPLYDEYCTL